MMLFRVIVALSFLVVSGCSLGGGECPCGASSSDPFSAHDLAFGGQHLLNESCFCQCGTDRPFASALGSDGTCDQEGNDCVDSRGTARQLDCY